MTDKHTGAIPWMTSKGTQDEGEVSILQGDVACKPGIDTNRMENMRAFRQKIQGDFSVKSAYQAFKNGPRKLTKTHKIWKLSVPPRVKVFAWLVSLNKILTIDNLTKRGWSLVNRCIMCRVQAESVSHLFNECSNSKMLYRMVEITLQVNLPGGQLHNDEDTVSALLNSKFSKVERSILLIAQFVLWRERCCRTFTEASHCLSELVQQVQMQWRYSLIATNQVVDR